MSDLNKFISGVNSGTEYEQSLQEVDNQVNSDADKELKLASNLQKSSFNIALKKAEFDSLSKTRNLNNILKLAQIESEKLSNESRGLDLIKLNQQKKEEINQRQITSQMIDVLDLKQKEIFSSGEVDRDQVKELANLNYRVLNSREKFMTPVQRKRFDSLHQKFKAIDKLADGTYDKASKGHIAKLQSKDLDDLRSSLTSSQQRDAFDRETDALRSGLEEGKPQKASMWKSKKEYEDGSVEKSGTYYDLKDKVGKMKEDDTGFTNFASNSNSQGSSDTSNAVSNTASTTKSDVSPTIRNHPLFKATAAKLKGLE